MERVWVTLQPIEDLVLVGEWITLEAMAGLDDVRVFDPGVIAGAAWL